MALSLLFAFRIWGLPGRDFRKSFASLDGWTVAVDVANQAVGMGRSFERFMGNGRQLRVSELGEGAGKGGLMEELAGVIPAAQLTKAMVGFEGFEQLAGIKETVNAFGGEGEAVIAG